MKKKNKETLIFSILAVKIVVGLFLVSALIGLFIGVYKYHSNQLDANLDVSKEMVSKMDDDKITYIKITTKDNKEYKSVEDFAKVAKPGDIVKCDILQGNGKSSLGVDGYVVKGNHTTCRLEGNIVKIIIKGDNKDASK